MISFGCALCTNLLVDQGYDISDYYKIAKCFGTMEDFERLLAEAKKRDMYIIMDLVINHCSDQHEWFQKALKDPEGEYAEKFYFKKGIDGQPPSNYRSYFGGNMWEPVEGYKDLYYYHSFAKQQPDINWNNETVLNDLYDMVNWWLDKGVAGFRVDAIINIKKDTSFPTLEADGPDGLCGVEKVLEQASLYGGKPSIGGMLQDIKHKTFDKHHAFTHQQALDMCNTFSRDNARTPMQWSDKEGAGFTTGAPWLAINPNHKEINVEFQEKDSLSVLNYYKKLLHFRKMEEYADALVDGKFVSADGYMQDENQKIFAFYRQGKSHTFLVISNWDEKEAKISVPEDEIIVAKHLDSMSANDKGNTDSVLDITSCREITLTPGQICIFEIR